VFEYKEPGALLGRSKIRRRILELLILEQDQCLHLREVARLVGTSAGTARRELQRLEAAGILERTVEGRQVYYQSHRDSPIARSVAEIVRATAARPAGRLAQVRPDPAGLAIARRLAAAIRDVYGPRLRGVYLFGSRARGDHRPESDVDVVIVLDQVIDYGSDLRASSAVTSDLSLESGLTITRLIVPERSWVARDRPIVGAAIADAIPV
jgi:predicted nucleotidyltransferase